MKTAAERSKLSFDLLHMKARQDFHFEESWSKTPSSPTDWDSAVHADNEDLAPHGPGVGTWSLVVAARDTESKTTESQSPKSCWSNQAWSGEPASIGGHGDVLSRCTTRRSSPSTSGYWDTEVPSAAPRGIVVLGLTPPFLVHNADEEWLKLLGFSRQEIMGKTLKIVQGPDTDLAALFEAVGTCSSDDCMSRRAKRIIFYNRDGEGVSFKVMAHAVTFNKDGDVPVAACKLCLYLPHEQQQQQQQQQQQVVIPRAGSSSSCDDDDDMDDTALEAGATIISSCTILPNRPYSIESLTVPFMSMFGLLETQAVGRDISVIFSSHETGSPWVELLDVALTTGMKTERVIRVSDSFCDEFTANVRCCPIFGQGGKQRKVEKLHLVFESMELADGQDTWKWDGGAGGERSSAVSASEETMAGSDSTSSSPPTMGGSPEDAMG